MGFRRNSAVALVAKSKCLNGDFGFGTTFVSIGALPPILLLGRKTDDVDGDGGGRGIPPLSDGCV